MAYDATDFVVTETPAPVVRDPRSITDPRERVAYLRDFLRELPDAKFDLRYMYAKNGQDVWCVERSAAKSHACGTSACIAGWAHVLFQPKTKNTGANYAAPLLGLSWEQADELFTPRGYSERPSPTPAEAANVLDRYLATAYDAAGNPTGCGQIDWSVA